MMSSCKNSQGLLLNQAPPPNHCNLGPLNQAHGFDHTVLATGKINVVTYISTHLKLEQDHPIQVRAATDVLQGFIAHDNLHDTTT
jgi:hypothetical protein